MRPENTQVKIRAGCILQFAETTHLENGKTHGKMETTIHGDLTNTDGGIFGIVYDMMWATR